MNEKHYFLNTLHVGLFIDKRVPNQCRYRLLKKSSDITTHKVNEFYKTDKTHPCYSPIDESFRIFIDGYNSDKLYEYLQNTKPWEDFVNEHIDTLSDILPKKTHISLNDALSLMDNANELIAKQKGEDYVRELNEKLREL